MNRRRMMMLQQKADSGIEIPAEYKRSFSIYNQRATWSEDVVRLEHFGSGYAGPSQGYMTLISRENKFGQNMGGAFPKTTNTPLNGFSGTKCYKLVLAVVKVNNNTATDSTTDRLDIAIGKKETYYTTSIDIKDIKVGTVLEVEMLSPTVFECVAFGSTVGSAIWSFDFKYSLVEV